MYGRAPTSRPKCRSPLHSEVSRAAYENRYMSSDKQPLLNSLKGPNSVLLAKVRPH